MIRFECSNCNHSIGAPVKYAGKRVRCPKCQEATRVPESAQAEPAGQPTVIKFRCPGCSQKIGLKPEFAGKRVKCAKCSTSIRVPQLPGQAAPPAPTPKPETPAPPAAEQSGESEDMFSGLGSLDDLLSAEQQMPSLELQPEPAAPEPEGVMDDFARFGGRMSQQDFEPKRKRSGGSSKFKMFGLIFVGVCLLCALVSGLVIMALIAATIEDQERRQQMIPQAEAVAEEYIRHMEEGEIDKASQLLSPELKAESSKEQLEGFATKISDSNIVSFECISSNALEHPQGSQFILEYNLEYEQDLQSVIMSVLEINDDFRIRGMGLRDPNFTTVAIGPQSYEELSAATFDATAEDLLSIFMGFACGFAIVIFFLGLIQVVSMWIIFEKAGEPGWAVLVPFYNMWTLARVGDLSGWIGIGVIFAGGVPMIGPFLEFFLWITISVGVAKAFDRGYLFAAGLLILPFIFYPILAFVD